MWRSRRIITMIALALGMGALSTQEARAQDDTERGWSFTSELSGVWTAGNSKTTTWGLGATVEYAWAHAIAKIEGGAVRSQSTLTTRSAVGTSDNFTLNEETVTEKTAEAYGVRGRYDYNFSPVFFAFGGGDWLRNTFSGIDSRLLLAAGAGNTWTTTDRVKFKTDYSATYTFQEDVVENPFVKTNFPGVRLGYDFWWKLTGSTEFTSVFVGDLNLDNTDDIRLDVKNSLPIAISSVLAFKPSLEILWRNEPSLTEVPLFNPDGSETGESVAVPLKKLDSLFKVALVVKF